MACSPPRTLGGWGAWPTVQMAKLRLMQEKGLVELRMRERSTGAPQRSSNTFLQSCQSPAPITQRSSPSSVTRPWGRWCRTGGTFQARRAGIPAKSSSWGAADAGSEPRPRTPSTRTAGPRDEEGTLQPRSYQPRANHGGFTLGPSLLWPQLRATCQTCSRLIRSLQQGPRDTPSPPRPGPVSELKEIAD